jgi:hypothetical protein|nr:lamin tail domain-containing protein [Kofleriaceae bacterium]
MLLVFAIAAIGAGACGPTQRPCVDDLAAGDVVITEVFAAPTGDGAGAAWLELSGAGARDVRLDGLEIVHSRPGVQTEHAHVVTTASLGSGQRLVLGAVDASALPPWIDYGFGGDLGDLRDGGSGVIELRCSGDVIARASYADVVVGHSRELASGASLSATDDDDPAMWCEGDTTEFAPGQFGTPGATSDCVPLAAGECQDGSAARALAAPAAGALAITEVMPNPNGAEGSREWLEIENAGSAAFDLVGLAVDRADDARAPDVVAGAACRSLAPGGYALFARSSDATANGGLPEVDGTFGFSMVNTGGAAQVLAADGSMLASFAWGRAPAGASLAVGSGSAVCAGSEPYGDGTNLGTPRAPNPPCGP